MRVVGVEPTRLAAQEPKSCASANSTIPAYSSILQLRPNRLNIVSVPAEKVNHCIDISALHSAYYRRTIVSFSMAERGFLPMRRSKLRRAGSIAATYLLVAALAVLGWLWHSLPAEILLEPGQTPYPAPFCLCAAAAHRWLPQRGQHAGCGQLSGHFVHWRVAARQDCARSGGNTSGGNRVRYAFRR